MFIVIDGFILRLFTKLCHRLQEWTGYTNWSVAAAGCVLAIGQCILCIMRWFWHSIPPLDTHEPGGLVVCNAWLLIQLTFQIIEAFKNEDRLYANKPPVILPGAVHYHWLRLIWILFVVVGVVDGLTYIGTFLWPVSVFHALGFCFGTTVREYASVVVPRPPGQSKIRQIIDAFFMEPVRVKGEI